MNGLTSKVVAGVITALVIAFLLASVTWPYNAITKEIEVMKVDINVFKAKQNDVESAVKVMQNDITYIKDGIRELKARP